MSNANTGKNLYGIYGLDARKYFVCQGLSVKKIKALTGVSTATLGKWRKLDEWNRRKKEHDNSNESLAMRLKESIKRFLEILEKPTTDWQEQAQLSAAIKRNWDIIQSIEGSFSDQQAASITFDNLTKYFRINHDKAAIELMALVLEPFMKFLRESE